MMLIRSTRVAAWTLLFFLLPMAYGGILRANKVLLLCHRTANRDLPENTLESLALAARMGCDVVEVDVRSTADGKLVLNHDGYLERFTDTTGEVETTDLAELDKMDFGAWMGTRFAGMHIAHFEDALHLARDLKIDLYLDIKTPGIGSRVLAALAREQMTQHVMFGGEWDDVRRLQPSANDDPTAWLQPGVTPEKVHLLHLQRKIVIANFIMNGHEFDLRGMKQAVAVGADGIMVDYPRLGAEAVGRPVEEKIQLLLKKGQAGATNLRVDAIRELSYYTGFPLQSSFLRWLADSDQQVSNEAAMALVASRPQPPLDSFAEALRSDSPITRSNAAWAIGSLGRPAKDTGRCAQFLSPLIHDADRQVVEKALVSLSRCQPDDKSVPVSALMTILTGNVPVLRGLAAVALARHHPVIAAREVPRQLQKDETALDAFEVEWTARGRPKLSQAQIDTTVELYRAQMKEIRALAQLPDSRGYRFLTAQAFRPGQDYSMTPILVSGFNIWDHLAQDATPALAALRSSEPGVADWAEWALIKAGPDVLPVIRHELAASHGDLRRRLIEILAWQADPDALPVLRSMMNHDHSEKEHLQWAIRCILAFDSRNHAAAPY